MAGAIAVAAVVALAGLWALSALTPEAASADGPFTSPHPGSGALTDNCAACHRSHTGQNTNLLNSSSPESTFCFTCHDAAGSGSNYKVQAEFQGIPANNPAQGIYYSHPATTASTHTSARADEFSNRTNRHSECGDCHDPHKVNAAAPSQTASGWTVSGALANITGVARQGGSLVWTDPVASEYQLCYKCHSGFTGLPSGKLDKAAELAPSNASYHPVEAAGKNGTTAMANSLAGGKLWRFTTSSTIRCTNCHGNYRLVGDPPALNTPASSARLAPHASVNRGILIANYRNRLLKTSTENYGTNDFALCYLCHKEAPFQDTSGDPRTDTNYGLHGFHVGSIADELGGGGSSTNIDTPWAGQGNAICAECHYRIHGTALARSGNQNYQRGVNFAPNVQPVVGETSPLWSGPANKTCTLVCHGKTHNPANYIIPTPTPIPTPDPTPPPTPDPTPLPTETPIP